MKTSGSAKGQILIYFDKLNKDLDKVEIYVSTSSDFKSGNVFYASGNGVQAKYIKVYDEWKGKTLYIKARYRTKVDGTEHIGEWSNVVTVKP